MEKEMRTWEGAAWIGIGVVMCALALRYDLGTFHAPGPGFLAMLAGLFASAIGVAMIIARTIARRQAGGRSAADQPFRLKAMRRLMYTAALLLAYIILIEPVGFLIATFLLMFGLFLDFEKKNYGWCLFFSLATAGMSYLVFEIWLRCQLPRGLLPWW